MTNFLEKKFSHIHGFGIFTKKKISKGEEFYRAPLDNISYKPNPRYIYIGNRQYVSDSKVLNWVNHSCNPNTLLNITKNSVVLIAIIDIAPGEEIVCDYDKTEIEGAKFKCSCPSKDCRGYIGKTL